MTNLRYISTALLIAGLALAFQPRVSAADIVIRRSDGQTIRGTFEKLTKTEIVVKRTKDEVTIPVSDLRTVQFDGEPIELGPARSNERSGALDGAMEKMTDIQKKYAGGNPRIKAELEFLVARILGKQALVDAAKAEEAKDALQKFRSANATNFRYIEATLLQSTVAGVAGDADAAKVLLEEVQGCAVPGFQLQAGVDLGRLLLKSGSAAEAQAAFEKVITESQDNAAASGALYNSMLGKALSLKAQSNMDEAIATLDMVIDKAPDTETHTLAEAWIRKGDCLREQQQLKPALMAYLHVDVLYSEEPAQHAEALMRLAELWGPGGHADRAADASSRLASLYPNSQWAKKGAGGG